jgi:hypothetical protein
VRIEYKSVRIELTIFNMFLTCIDSGRWARGVMQIHILATFDVLLQGRRSELQALTSVVFKKYQIGILFYIFSNIYYLARYISL